MTEKIVEFIDVQKKFGDHVVMKGISIPIYKGETVTVMGGSGIGKSVFLKLLLGVMKPDEGNIFYKGKLVNEMKWKDLRQMRSKVGMLFQGAALFDSMTVAENIAYPLREHFNLSETQIFKKVEEKLDIVGLRGTEDMMPSDLSGGMKKRVGLARAIAADPEMILYDEPTTGLDPANSYRICRLILDLQKRLGVTSVVVTHDMEAAFMVSDRMALLNNKVFHFIGTVDEVKASSDKVVKNFINGQMETGE